MAKSEVERFHSEKCQLDEELSNLKKLRHNSITESESISYQRQITKVRNKRSKIIDSFLTRWDKNKN
ncbi:hypothetical protein M3175_21015 [Robertmurraya korlensis]|uniref:hypothetical protein n=1 Tax=Robertmurraya korlensis TaxID=519977 RepID=UPI00203ED863|nr:hypothetical protein [Robertmurraya korlensis]MCM3603223.1 hypothetical protein [Robertmurraya korlensis]